MAEEYGLISVIYRVARCSSQISLRLAPEYLQRWETVSHCPKVLLSTSYLLRITLCALRKSEDKGCGIQLMVLGRKMFIHTE